MRDLIKAMPEPPAFLPPYRSYYSPEDHARATRQLHASYGHQTIQFDPALYNQIRRAADNFGIPVSTIVEPVVGLWPVAEPARDTLIYMHIKQVKAATRRIEKLARYCGFPRHSVSIVISRFPLPSIIETHFPGITSESLHAGSKVRFLVPCEPGDYTQYLDIPLEQQQRRTNATR